MRLFAGILLVFAIPVAAQLPATPAASGPAKYVNNGRPIKVAFTCTEEHFKEYDLSCSNESPCPVFLELTAAAQAATRVFVTGNFHTSSTTLSSVLLSSEDEGRSWTEGYARQLGAGLEHIQFFDFSTGWVSGAILGAPPRDPFFLLTTDGGVTWRRRPVYSETRPGVIDQFLFDNARQGHLLIDRTRPSEEGHRYELYQTMTGGDSWSVQQVSREPLKLPRAREERSGWRVRADGASKSFAVEQMDGARWRTTASFLIDAGKCVPPEPAN